MRAHTCPTLCIHGERPELSPTCQVSHHMHSKVMKAAQALCRNFWFIHLPVNCFLHNVFRLLLCWFYQLLSHNKFLWALWASRSRQKVALSTSWDLQKCLARLQLSGDLCLDPLTPLHSLSVSNTCCTPAALSCCWVPMGLQPSGEKLQQLWGRDVNWSTVV